MSENPGNANLPIGSTKNPTLPIGSAENANREIGVPGDAWRSRGYLPHLESANVIQHVCFHLADSLPKSVLERLDIELKSLPMKNREIERRKRLDAWIDAGHGSCVLRERTLAEMMENTLLHFDADRYHLLAWVVMPNHVHALLQPIDGWTAGRISASWKKFAARKICEFRRKANQEIGVPGAPVWHRECWDRYMRDERHLQQTIEYIHQNPVKARLAPTAEAWPWSSARSPGTPISCLAPSEDRSS
jgi:REP element-mobilizing transposase RayT